MLFRKWDSQNVNVALGLCLTGQFSFLFHSFKNMKNVIENAAHREHVAFWAFITKLNPPLQLMSECIYRAAPACDPASNKVKSEVSVQITSRTKAGRAEAHKEFNESEDLQSGDKQAVHQSHFFTNLKN